MNTRPYAVVCRIDTDIWIEFHTTSFFRDIRHRMHALRKYIMESGTIHFADPVEV